MRKLILLLLFVTFISGCGPPRIPQQNNHFENEYFTLDYPATWIFRPEKQKIDYTLNFYGVKSFSFELKDENYPRYMIKINVLEKQKDMFQDFVASTPLDEGAMKFISAMQELYSKDGFVVSQNPANMSDIKFNGISAKFISLLLKKEAKKIALDSNSIFFIYSGRQYQISYAIYPNFKNITRARIESIVYSFRPKD
ncbi:MAG: hypothetical protein FJZ10_03830 [Candidatus Omnitrophica bacterium]|nr:hypothetical protein [Candidatus Omnitrophota bacterium]